MGPQAEKAKSATLAPLIFAGPCVLRPCFVCVESSSCFFFLLRPVGPCLSFLAPLCDSDLFSCTQSPPLRKETQDSEVENYTRILIQKESKLFHAEVDTSGSFSADPRCRFWRHSRMLDRQSFSGSGRCDWVVERLVSGFVYILS